MSESLISAEDMAELTDLDESAMPDTATITAITSGTDLGGAPTETEATTTSPCRFVPASGREISGDALRERGSYRLYLPRGAAISGTSRVTIGGRSYRVVWTPPLHAYRTSRVVGLEDA